MLIPRFSLRGLLGLVTVSSLFFLIVSYAMRGEHWAIAVVVALLSVIVVAVVHSLFFSLALLASALSPKSRAAQQPRSPFAADAPAPQIITPIETE